MWRHHHLPQGPKHPTTLLHIGCGHCFLYGSQSTKTCPTLSFPAVQVDVSHANPEVQLVLLKPGYRSVRPSSATWNGVLNLRQVENTFVSSFLRSSRSLSSSPFRPTHGLQPSLTFSFLVPRCTPSSSSVVESVL